MTETGNHSELEAALGAVGAEKSAAEAHGILCGLFSTPGEPEQARWIAEVLANTEPRGEPARRCLQQLTELFESTRREMQADDVRFTPLVPDDEAALQERATALGAWCEGYLFGLGVGGLESREELPAEAAEVVGDFGEIARVDTETDMGDEGEAAYAELLEYVRVGALLVREHLAAPAGGATAAPDGAAQPPH